MYSVSLKIQLDCAKLSAVTDRPLMVSGQPCFKLTWVSVY